MLNNKLKKILKKLGIWKIITLIKYISKKIVLPGFDGLPLYDVASFFFKGMMEGAITMRASSLAFKFFLALFPAVIFFFTLIPYIPVDGFQEILMGMIKQILPDKTFDITKTTIEDIIKHQHGGILSIGFIMTIYFSTNGVFSIIEAFNQTYHTFETRSEFKQRLISLLLVFIIALMVIIAIGLVISEQTLLKYLVHQGILKSHLIYNLIRIGNWVILLALCFFTISILYYMAPAKKVRFRFISAGSTLATLLIIITSLGFNFYINNFSKYNALYGSIGTLIIILMWFYFNSIILLIGFELNASISNAKKNQKTPKKNRYWDNISGKKQ
jgi:membrane protein